MTDSFDTQSLDTGLLYNAGQLMALEGSVFLANKYRQSWVYMRIMLVLTVLDVGVMQKQQQRSIHNVSRVIEDLLETYDIRLRPRFGGR